MHPCLRNYEPGRTAPLKCLALFGVAALTACSGFPGNNAGPAPAGSSTVALTPASAPTPTVSSGSDSSSSPRDWCAGLQARANGTVSSPKLIEISGLAASQSHPGVIWAHNDSGNRPAVFAVGPDGADLGSFPLLGVAGVDIEDMALVDGTIYLADIGDNDEIRTDVAVYRFDEPDPGGSDRIDNVEVLRFRYPDRAHDAEAMLVDPISGEIVIIDKQFQFAPRGTAGPLAAAAASIFVAAPPLVTHQVIELRAAGTVALDVLNDIGSGESPPGTIGQLGLGGLATGADIRPDGRVIALRTYATVWLFDRPPDSTVTQALAGTPCETPSRPEAQGEAVAFLPGPDLALVTIGEGVNPDVNVIGARQG